MGTKKMDSEMLTWSGRLVCPLDMRPCDIEIVDIAWSLAKLNRYNGHTLYPYSVAQHSVIVSWLVPQEFAWYGLMHDAPEAYLGDVIAPIKGAFGDGYAEAEDRLYKAICKRFGRACLRPKQVDEIDKRIRYNEQMVLQRLPAHLVKGHEENKIVSEGLGAWLESMLPYDAGALFMSRFNELSEKGGDHG